MAGGRRSEVGGRKTEVGGQSEIRNQRGVFVLLRVVSWIGFDLSRPLRSLTSATASSVEQSSSDKAF